MCYDLSSYRPSSRIERYSPRRELSISGGSFFGADLQSATFGSTISREMGSLLQRILLDRDQRFIFVCTGTRYLARTDLGQVRGAFEDLCLAFTYSQKRGAVSPGWKVGLSDEWRRRQNVVVVRGVECVRFLHFLSPDQKLIVLDFYYQPLPMQVVDELKAFLDSFNPPSTVVAVEAEGESHAEGQLHGQPVPEAHGDPAAEGSRGEHVEEHEGLPGAQGYGDRFAEGPRGEDPERRRSLGVVEEIPGGN